MRGLCFKAIDLSNAKLFVFVDGFFANNKDQSFQIGYVIIFANKHSYTNTNKFTIKGNTIYWSLIKCQYITQNVLASKIYSIVNRFDLRFAIKLMLATICKKINLAKILLVLCTNSYLLY